MNVALDAQVMAIIDLGQPQIENTTPFTRHFPNLIRIPSYMTSNGIVCAREKPL